MQSGTEIIDGLFFKPMTVGRRKCIVGMHESGLVLRADKFGDLILQLGQTQVERLNGLTIFISDILVFPYLLGRAFGLPISGSEPIDQLLPSR
jgi:hypothetical protein